MAPQQFHASWPSSACERPAVLNDSEQHPPWLPRSPPPPARPRAAPGLAQGWGGHTRRCVMRCMREHPCTVFLPAGLQAALGSGKQVSQRCAVMGPQHCWQATLAAAHPGPRGRSAGSSALGRHRTGTPHPAKSCRGSGAAGRAQDTTFLGRQRSRRLGRYIAGGVGPPHPSYRLSCGAVLMLNGLCGCSSTNLKGCPSLLDPALEGGLHGHIGAVAQREVKVKLGLLHQRHLRGGVEVWKVSLVGCHAG